MNNARFLKEAKELEARWGQKGLLDGINDKYSRAVTAVMLEGQRLMNELPWPPVNMLCPECDAPLVPSANGATVSCGQHRTFRGTLGEEAQCYTVQCLLCERDLTYDQHEFVYNGGKIEIEFGYGSHFDQGKGVGGSHGGDDELLAADVIEGYICDSCFEKKRKFLRGFKVTKRITREPV